MFVVKCLFVVHCALQSVNCGQWDNESRDSLLGFKNLDVPPPAVDLSRPLTIETYVTIDGIGNLNVKDMEVRIDWYLIHKWKVGPAWCDHYVKTIKEAGVPISGNKQVRAVITEPTFDELFWWPDTFADVAKSEKTPALGVSFTRIMELQQLETINDTKGKVSHNCSLTYKANLATILGCQMSLKEYPIDLQNCSIPIRSYAYSTELLNYVWGKEKPITIRDEIVLPTHYLTHEKVETLRTVLHETYSLVQLELFFARRIEANWIGTYAPSFLIVVISWLSFYMSLEGSIPGRVTLCVTAFLALVTQFSSVRKDLPNVSYINGIDIWMLVCLTFVFGTIVQFAIVKFLAKHKELALTKRNEFDDLMRHEVISPKVNYVPQLTKSVRKTTQSRKYFPKSSNSTESRIKYFNDNELVIRSQLRTQRVKQVTPYLSPMSPWPKVNYKSVLNSPEIPQNAITIKRANRNVLINENLRTISRDLLSRASRLNYRELWKSAIKSQITKSKPKSPVKADDSNVLNPVTPPPKKNLDETVLKIEKISRVLFPVAFLLFNISYWLLVYLRWL